MSTKALPEAVFRMTEDHVNNRYSVTVGEDILFGDLFIPQFWAAGRERLRLNDICRVIAKNKSFDVELTVDGFTDCGGVVVRLKNKLPPEVQTELDRHLLKAIAETECAVPRIEAVPIVNGKPVVRIEHTGRGGKWRLIGLGNTEIKRGMSRPEAQEALAAYLKDSCLRLPDDDDEVAA